jgi:hypothetical protein
MASVSSTSANDSSAITSINISNADRIFFFLLRDDIFMTCIDTYMSTTINASTDSTFATTNVPQLVLLIMTLLCDSKTYCKGLKNDTELQELLNHFYSYCLEHIIKTPKTSQVFNKAEFKHAYDICARLAITKLKYKKPCLFSCM